MGREVPHGIGVASNSRSPSVQGGHRVASYHVVWQISGAAALTRLW